MQTRQERVYLETPRHRIAGTLTLARDAPTQVSQIMSDLADGTLRFKVEVSDSPHVEKTHNRRARLWTCAILSIGC